uniref:BRCA1-A complex subunit RAP80 n=1 Tax=Electrophorus electricus TaxID=8005 RepID=A0AAY5EDZ0_ELEEL
MPRRKRTTAQNERQRKVRRTDNNEDALVISDSENEEVRASQLANFSEVNMTEEEMLDLAMRLSKQEANTAAHRQQLEDDDMKKAIAESLHVRLNIYLSILTFPFPSSLALVRRHFAAECSISTTLSNLVHQCKHPR